MVKISKISRNIKKYQEISRNIKNIMKKIHKNIKNIEKILNFLYYSINIENIQYKYTPNY